MPAQVMYFISHSMSSARSAKTECSFPLKTHGKEHCSFPLKTHGKEHCAHRMSWIGEAPDAMVKRVDRFGGTSAEERT